MKMGVWLISKYVTLDLYSSATFRIHKYINSPRVKIDILRISFFKHTNIYQEADKKRNPRYEKRKLID